MAFGRPGRPILDVGIIYLLQHRSLAVAPSPGYVVGWSIGLSLFALLVATMTFQPSVLWATVATAAVAQAALVFEGGLGWDLVATSATLLVLSALVTTAYAGKMQKGATALFEEEAARREAEQRAASLKHEHEAVRAWTELAVHDLRQPLTTAISFAELCVRDLAGGRGNPRDDLAVIAGELRRLEQMVGDLLILSRLEEGVLRPKLSEEALAPFLERIRSVHGAEAAVRGITIEVAADPALRARLDPLLMRRAIENLISNALRFVQSGDRLRLHAERQDGGLVVAVQNSGPPVPAEERPKLFEKRSTSANDHRHAGLGLYFCRLVAEAHDGGARLAANADWNVDFRLHLPA